MPTVARDPVLEELEADPWTWLLTCFPNEISSEPADFHRDFWAWLWGLQPMQRASLVECVFRGGAKTTSLELGLIAMACRGRRYGLYVMRTQDQADDKVANVAGRLEESPEFGLFYPLHAQRRVGVYGSSKGWRRNRLRTRGGFTLDAAGLDKATRGLKVEDARPDVIFIDDIDEPHDTLATIAKQETRLSRSVLPARAGHAVVVFMQNLVHEDGVMARLLDGRAGYLRRAQRVGPIPAVTGFAYEEAPDPAAPERRMFRVTAGQPTWPGAWSLDRCEEELNEIGPTAFLAEMQHQPQDVRGQVFGHLDFAQIRISPDDVPELERVIVRVDPATSGDAGSAQGVAAAGLDADGIIYLVQGFEGRCGPAEALGVAIRMAIGLGSREVGVETIQGGRVWESAWREALLSEGERAAGLKFVPVPSVGRLSKEARIAEMVPDLELHRCRIVEGAHHPIEAALSRFPNKPTDLADSLWHVWRALKGSDSKQKRARVRFA